MIKKSFCKKNMKYSNKWWCILANFHSKYSKRDFIENKLNLLAICTYLFVLARKPGKLPNDTFKKIMILNMVALLLKYKRILR